MRRFAFCTACMLAAWWGTCVCEGQVTIVGSPQNYTTIAAAVAAAGPSATIQVSAAGSYSQESFTVGQPGVTIRGVNGTPVVSATTQWTILASGCTMENLSFEFGGQGANPVRALMTATGFTVRNCSFRDPATGTGSANRVNNVGNASSVSCALTVESRSNVLIEDCTFIHTDPAVTSAVNSGSLRFPDADGQGQTALVQRCSFRAPDVCIQIDDGWADMTIRDCRFEVPNRTFGAVIYHAGIWVDPLIFDPLPANNVTRNLRILGCDFSFVEDTCIAFNGAHLDDVLIDNCDLGNAGNHCVHTENTGGFGLAITNCILDNKPAGENEVVNTDAVWFNPNNIGSTLVVNGIHIAGNQFREWGNTAINFHGKYREVLVEDNDFGTGSFVPYFYGILQRHSDQQMQVRRNNFLQLNGGAVYVYGRGCTVTDNLIIQTGAVGGSSTRGIGLYGALPTDGVPVQPGDNIIAYNVMANLKSDGIWELAHTDPYHHAGDRIFNNTIVYCGGNGMLLGGDRGQVFNNIIVACGSTGSQAGINLQAGAGLAVEDFNLLFNTNNFLGWSTPGPHDMLGVNPRFVDIATIENAKTNNLPLTPAQVLTGLALASDSPARRAGTNPASDLSAFDYLTDLGAIRSAGFATRVPASGWELYR